MVQVRGQTYARSTPNQELSQRAIHRVAETNSQPLMPVISINSINARPESPKRTAESKRRTR
jgi:hypothetical protein